MSKFKIVTQRLDAGESVFFARQLEYIFTEVINVEYPELKARTLIPINTQVPSGASSFTYRIFDRVGWAKIIANYAEDLPRIDILGKEETAKVHVIGDSFGYTVQDIKRAQLTGVSLEQEKAAAAREAALRTENSAAMIGDSRYNMAGLLNHANMTLVTLLADGTGTSKHFDTKTADQLVRDVEALINAPSEATEDIENPDTVGFSIRAYNILKAKKIGIDSGMTVLKFLKENNPGVNFVKIRELKNLGDSGTTDRMIAYRRDPSRLVMFIPQDFTMLPPQEEGLGFVVNCYQEFGGVCVKRPASIAYADGIMAD